MNKVYKSKECPACGITLTKLWFTARMTEEWSWNGMQWECSAKHSLVNSPNQNVICPECDSVVGVGRDFGF